MTTLPSCEDCWPPPIRPIEQTEADRLAGLGQSLHAAIAAGADALRHALCTGPLRGDFRSVLAQLGAARLLRVLHWLGEELTDHEPALALIADDCPDAAALRAAIDNLVRQATLARLLDRSRIDALVAAVATAKREEG
ncbi:MAG TPA: hypothetical protein VKI44_28495 [Acetobacteraceae bacterium]|nr:hypothetical protein [Acetobacteraceae bacterium]